ncbi:MAG: hypothetical protein ACI8ZB_004383 [Desulforhopalus sp.]|jgi:hypothetical protein
MGDEYVYCGGLMSELKRFRKNDSSFVIAIKLDLITEGFNYNKWGGLQRCKAGDWLVDNDGDIYTVDSEVFAKMYGKVSPGQYVKTFPVWARVSEEAGVINTKEGVSHFKKGDYLVFNNEDGSDGYCISVSKFNSMYVEDK